MDWSGNIERNRTALFAIVASLFAMLAGEGPLPAAVRTTILRILRPAESAVRRLIVVTAARMKLKPATARLLPANIPWTGTRTNASVKPRPRFRLTDPLPPLLQPEPALPHQQPRILNIGPIDPTIPALFAARQMAQRVMARREQSQGDAGHDIARLTRRLQAMEFALHGLKREALRLLRWKARRQRLAQTRLVYTQPLRPGKPPGHSAALNHPVALLLQDCHRLVFESRYDTS